MLTRIAAFALAAALPLAAPASAASVDGLPIKSSTMGSGQTVVFVHGWTCDESSWDAQVREFAEDYRVVTLDLPGHGISGQPELADFSIELFARAVEAVRAETGAERIVLVGHSMGAPVIRQYALDHPDHVAGLVAVDGPLDMRAFAGGARPTNDFGIEARKGMIASFFTPDTPAEVKQKVTSMMLIAPEATAEGAMTAMFSGENDVTTPVRAPALEVLAGTSFLTDDPKAREVAPDLEVKTVPGTGHFVMMEQPAAFNAILRQFLQTRARY